MKRKISVFMIVIIVLSLICSCKTDESVRVAKYQKNTEIKDEIKISLENIKSFNPYKEMNFSNLKALNLIYEPLFIYDDEMRAVPLLAESFEILDGGKAVSIRLKDNIKWHNGDLFLANDVIYTINLILSSKSLYSKGIIEKAEVIDNKTVKITFINPQINIPEKLMFPIVKSNSDEVIGTGPFKFVEKESSDTYSFSYFEDYHSEKMEEISVKMINCPDSEAVKSLFHIGETDILIADAFDYAEFNRNDDINLFEYPTNELLYIGFNLDNSIFCERNTRQALLYIPDKKEIAENVMNKKVSRADFPINPQSFLYPKELELQKDNEYAKTLLEKDSWTRVGGVFKRGINENFQTLKINMLVKDTQEMKMVSGVIEKNLDNFGIECDVLVKPEPEFEESIKNKEYDMFIDSKMLSGSMDFEKLTAENNSFEDLSQLTERIKTENDEKKLRLLYTECASVFLKEVRFVPLFFYKDAVLYKNGVLEDIVSRLCIQNR